MTFCTLILISNFNAKALTFELSSAVHPYNLDGSQCVLTSHYSLSALAFPLFHAPQEPIGHLQALLQTKPVTSCKRKGTAYNSELSVSKATETTDASTWIHSHIWYNCLNADFKSTVGNLLTRVRGTYQLIQLEGLIW